MLNNTFITSDYYRYMYTGKVRSFAFDDVARVLSTARRFQLEEQIGYQYASTIDNLNCKLTIAQLDIICKYANKDSFDILVRTIFQRPEALNDVEFGLLSQETVEAIIKSDALPVEELDILKAVYFWSECEARRKGIEKTARNLRALLGPVFYQVRFPLIDIKVLNRNNLPYTMLTKIELEGLNDMSNGLLHRVPKKFSSKKRSEALPTTDTSVLTCHKSTSAPVHSIDPTYLPRKINKRSASVQNIPKACLPIVSTCSYETIPVISESEFRQLRQTHHFQGSKYVGLHSIQRFKYITGPLELKYAEEVSFTCSECVILNGIQLFGTYRAIGSYNGTVEVSLSQQANILREKFAFESECKKPKLYDIYFRTPVIILAKQTYTICVSIEGPGTFFGINGSRFVESKTGVVFKFVDSGELDVFVGQMPGLLFSIPLNKELEKYE
ncbi:hypothetical protein DPMN_041829 [Dreissena polymorpha]|uniref:PHR domain-containing protein n=1 Tax=Dreissena polymorpha TaxID=45954 RepID=A0A9D4HWJ1_DREPO|nr:hypothetical protein DPMN_041829 [Dreissena polymorpha]